MKSKIIKSKRLKDRIVEIIEYKDDFGKIVNYSVINVNHGEGVIAGAGKLEENNFSNEEEAMIFFNNQN
ncbi:MAG: hypothetical protein HYT31_03555 [Parcubacteria group bacterium]|nr:hypothetical protein [Parcubacteria group bacterium]